MKRRSLKTFSLATLLLTSLLLFSNSFYIQAKAYFAQILIAAAWEQTLAQPQLANYLNHPVRPWRWADTYPVAKLSVPNKGIEQYVLAGATGSPLAFAPGLYAGTRLPGVDSPSTPYNTVIAGHHNTHFAFLKQLDIGDHIVVQNHLGKLITYHVDKVDHYDIRHEKMPVSHDRHQLQLVTCSPQYPGEIHPNQRLVVTATSR